MHFNRWIILPPLIAGFASANAYGEPPSPKEEAQLTIVHFKTTAALNDSPLDEFARISTEYGYHEKRGLLKINAPEDSFLRAFINKKTGAVTYQVYATISYGGEWRHFNYVHYEVPNSSPASAELTKIDEQVGGCSQYGCTLEEDFGFDVSEDLLRLIAKSAGQTPLKYWTFRFDAHDGSQWNDQISANEIEGLFEAVADYKNQNGLENNALQTPPVTAENRSSSPGDADELRKWADLFAAGVISKDQFEKKKTEILSR